MAHPKGLLIERAQKLGLERPEFETTQTGPEHEPSFLTDVTVGGELLGTGQGSSKREAERRAAEEALAALDGRDDAPSGKAAKAKRGEAAAPKAGAPKAAAAKAGAPKVGAAKLGAGKAVAEKPGAAKPAAEKAKGEKPTPTRAAPAVEAAREPVGAVEPGPAPEEPFMGPWPMLEDLLASVVTVAERRVSGDLRGDEALSAIRDFALRLYKDLLADLGEVVEEDVEDEGA